jgi:hypothetical protein
MMLAGRSVSNELHSDQRIIFAAEWASDRRQCASARTHGSERDVIGRFQLAESLGFPGRRYREPAPV